MTGFFGNLPSQLSLIIFGLTLPWDSLCWLRAVEASQIFMVQIVCMLLWYNGLQSVLQHFTILIQSSASSSAAMNYIQKCKKFPFCYLLVQPATALWTNHTLAIGSKWQANNLHRLVLSLLISEMLHLTRSMRVDRSEGRRLYLSVTVNKIKYILNLTQILRSCKSLILKDIYQFYCSEKS